MNDELKKLLDIIIKEKGGSYKDYRLLMDKIGYHESKSDYKAVQDEGGPGRGKYQYEIGENKGANTAVNRLYKYYKQNKLPIPNWVKNIPPGKSVDASQLKDYQQDILFLADKMIHPKADFSKVINGEQSTTDFWLQNHWSGKDKDVNARTESFNRDLEEFESQKKPVNNIPTPGDLYSYLAKPKEIELPSEDPNQYDRVWNNNQFASGGSLDDCECGCPGKPPCEREKVSKKDENSIMKYLNALDKGYDYSQGVDNLNFDIQERESVRKQKRKERLYELNNNPNRLEGESDELYSTRQKMFERKRKQNLNVQSKMWENLKEKQSELPFAVKAVSEIITSPVDIAYYIKENTLNADSTKQFKSKKRIQNDNLNFVDSLGDAATLIAPWARGMKAPSLLHQAKIKLGRELIQEKIFESLENDTQFANGGKLNSNINQNEFNEFNSGGSHQSNPYGGIPMGMGQNGKPNTVEQNETSYTFEDGKYIFSARLGFNTKIK